MTGTLLGEYKKKILYFSPLDFIPVVTFLTPLTKDFLSWNKGSLGLSFEVSISTENQNQESFYPYVQHEISVLIELPLGHLCCLLTDVPPQPNSPTNNVFNLNLKTNLMIRDYINRLFWRLVFYSIL
jgi:hypothetical protein